MDLTRPLPAEGKMVVIVSGRTTECLLRVPVASTASLSAQELAPVGWLTIGHLVSDGIALQVALQTELARCSCETSWCWRSLIACRIDC